MQCLFCVCAVLTSFLDMSRSPSIFEEEKEEDPFGIDEFLQEQLKKLQLDESVSVLKHGEDGFRYNVSMCPAYVLFMFRSCLVMLACVLCVC